MNPLPADIHDFLHDTPFHSCLLLVHPEIARLRSAANELLDLYGWQRLSIGQDLSQSLLAVEPRHRSRATARWMEAQLPTFRPGPLLCTDIDLLFDPALKLDPPTLLRSTSRNTRLVTMWPGTYQHGALAYAVPEHEHYRTWNNLELSIGILE